MKSAGPDRNGVVFVAVHVCSTTTLVLNASWLCTLKPVAAATMLLPV